MVNGARVRIACVFGMLVFSALSHVAFSSSPPSDTLEAKAADFSRQLSTAEWLGPMSAVALSPFFGLTCLSGLATYGPDWATQNSLLLGDTGPMNNPVLFWVMFSLTIVTSLPRFTKLSKPLALLAETLESYSAIIILIAIKFSPLIGVSSGEPEVASQFGEPLVHAGIGALSADIMFSIVAATNIIVINTIKLSCEFFVWLIPIPFVDSIFETINKTACATLAILYAYSPISALLVNFVLFLACALIFVQVTRYLRYFKYLYVFPVLRSAVGYNESESKSFSGFLTQRWRQLPSKTELQLIRVSGDRLEVNYPTWLTTYPKGIAAIKQIESSALCDKLTILLEGERLVLEVRKGIFPKTAETAVALGS
ncbi:hypothetical protein SH449x_000357 [Pirellulaceae bacterium SH449]